MSQHGLQMLDLSPASGPQIHVVGAADLCELQRMGLGVARSDPEASVGVLATRHGEMVG
jgi:hypothetical protein